MATVAPRTPRRPQGRPRRLTLDDIIEAACAIGLDELDMAGVAAKLGTGVATLYGYVEGHEHLRRLVLGRMGQGALIADHGQSWQDVLREHAEALFVTYRRCPQLVTHTMDGTRRTLADIGYFDHLLKMLVARGMAPAAALSVYFEVNQIVNGAVVGFAYRASAEAAAGGAQALRHELLAACEAGGFSALRDGIDAIGLPPTLGDYRASLERLIASLETHA